MGSASAPQNARNVAFSSRERPRNTRVTAVLALSKSASFDTPPNVPSASSIPAKAPVDRNAKTRAQRAGHCSSIASQRVAARQHAGNNCLDRCKVELCLIARTVLCPNERFLRDENAATTRDVAAQRSLTDCDVRVEALLKKRADSPCRYSWIICNKASISARYGSTSEARLAIFTCGTHLRLHVLLDSVLRNSEFPSYEFSRLAISHATDPNSLLNVQRDQPPRAPSGGP